MTYLKKIVYIFLLVLISVGIQAQVLKADFYTIKSAGDMFGIAIKSGTLIFNMADQKTYLIKKDVSATETLESVSDNILVISDKTSQNTSGSFSNIADITAFGAVGDGSTDITEAFRLAWKEANVILIPGSINGKIYKVGGELRVPPNKKLVFDRGAKLDVRGTLIGNETELQAGLSQIFTMSSNISGTWIYNEAYPEWFGAKGDSATRSGAAIEKCLQTFVHRVKAYGDNYLIEETIDFPQFGDLEMGSNTRFTNHFRMYDPIIRISKEKFYLRGGTIQILWYHDMYDGNFMSGTAKDAYTGWVVDIALERDYLLKKTSFRQNSYIKDLTIIPSRSPGERNKQSLIYDGIRITSADINDASYFVEVSNLYIGQADTALYLQGHPESGMINSWHFNSYTSDGSLHAIVLGHRAAGNIFTNTVIQPYTKKPWGSTVQIDIASKYNTIQGFFWDIHCDSSIVLRYDPEHKPIKIEAAHNTISLNWANINKYIIEERSYYNYNNIVVPTGLKPGKYYEGIVTTKGNGRMRIGGYDDTYLHRGERLQVSGNLEFYSVNESRVKISRVSNLGAGNVPIREKMSWMLRFVDDDGDTSYYSKSFSENISGQPGKMRVDFTAAVDDRVRKTLVYRQKKTGNSFYFAGMVDNKIDTSFIDNKPDADLGHKAIFDKRDETAGGIYKDGKRYITFSNKNTTVSEKLIIDDVLILNPRKGPPPNPLEGEVYINATDHHIYCFLNGIWKRLD